MLLKKADDKSEAASVIGHRARSVWCAYTAARRFRLPKGASAGTTKLG